MYAYDRVIYIDSTFYMIEHKKYLFIFSMHDNIVASPLHIYRYHRTMSLLYFFNHKR
jgi:hypothetical protein